MFNKETSLLRNAVNIPSWFYFDLASFVSYDMATEAERKEHKDEIETCGGLLKVLDYKEAWKKAWDSVNEEEHAKVKLLPNFDADIFFEITGIKVES